MSDIPARLRGPHGFQPECYALRSEAGAEIERLERGINRIYEYLVANRIGDAMFDCEALLCGGKHQIRHPTDTDKR